MYTSYFVLFARFFHNAYFNNSARKTKKMEDRMLNDSPVKFENDIKFHHECSKEDIMEDTTENTSEDIKDEAKDDTTEDTKEYDTQDTTEDTKEDTTEDATEDTRKNISDDSTKRTETPIHSVDHGDEMMISNGWISAKRQEDEDKKLK